ncbi:glutaminase A [Microbacteriaceae bacterium K1510]|nr:glutaminase A [Microbacteriaceae bacterium K1510]
METSSRPSGSYIDQLLGSIHARVIGDNNGELASYIPELANADANQFGVAIATANGKLYSFGNVDTKFTIQSISKALTYCLVLELKERKDAFARVGVEPSGDPFNAIEFDARTNRPYNPMVNAGAITVAGILRDELGHGAFDFVLNRFSEAAGRPLALNEKVYLSEVRTGHRNRAIGHLLLGMGALTDHCDEAVDLYFRQCSIDVDTVSLATIGATLANLGENPFTGKQVFDVGAVRDTLAVMFTCGMYDYAGNWAFDVGVPAKSGVGGGILGIVNRQLGIGTYSPRLDRNGNSVRGLAAFKALSDELGLHAFDPTNAGSSLVESFFRDSPANGA